MTTANRTPGRLRDERPLGRLPAGAKLGGAFILVLVTAVLPEAHARWLWAVAAVLVLVVALGRVSLCRLGWRLLLLSPFVAGVALAGALRPGGGVGWQLVAARSALSLVTVLVVAETTAFQDMLRVMQRIRVPALLVTTLALMHRYLFVLLDESGRMRRARAARTFRPARGFAWAALASVAAQLFVRASERAERIYAAMCARGWR